MVLPKIEQLSEDRTTDISPIVQIKVEDSLKGAIFYCKESTKKTGKVVFLEISGFVPVQPEGYEVHIKSSTPKEMFVETLRESHISGKEGNTFNTTLSKEGVFMEKPNKNNFNLMLFFSPLKVSFAGIYGCLVWFFSTSPFSQIGYFTLFAFLEALLAIFPNVHSKEKKRFNTLYIRFIQWAGALIFGSGLLSSQSLAIASNASGLGGKIAQHIFGFGMGFLITIYISRLISSAFKLFYGEKADSVKKKMASLFPKPLRKFINDKDISG